jgi:hypothetical protein
MRGRLNLFQATMLRWRDLHPYSAVHMVRVTAPCDPGRLKEQIESRLRTAGLTGLTLDRRRSRFEFQGGSASIEFTMLSGGTDPRATARLEIVRQLNMPFARDGRFSPFRFFVIDGGSFFDVGLAYDHFIAGGDSIAVLLRHCLAGYGEERTTDAPRWSPRLYPHTYRRLFMRHLGSALRGLAYLPELTASARRAYRAPCHGAGDASNGFLYFRVDNQGFGNLRRTAKVWGVTVNELYLAMLLSALDPAAAGRRSATRRQQLGVASIVNLRSELESDARATFGQFLSSLRISHPIPPGTGLEQLAALVHAETHRIRTRRLYLQSLLALGVSGFMWRFLSPDQRRCFFAKHYPIWGGITSLYVDPLWNGASGATPLSEYVRAVSTGPLAPLVFAITTLGDAAWLGVTYRTADVSTEAADAAAQGFLRCIASLG